MKKKIFGGIAILTVATIIGITAFNVNILKKTTCRFLALQTSKR
jgi:hypothetical protein